MTHSAQDDLATLLFTRANPNAESEAAIAMAASVGRTLRMAASLASVGRSINIDGLDNWVGRLAARVLDLEPTKGRDLRPELVALLADLDRLEHAMRAPEAGTPPA